MPDNRDTVRRDNHTQVRKSGYNPPPPVDKKPAPPKAPPQPAKK